ncbi:MAG TPA: hypothetical protein VN516_10345 [Candidatus Baltobacteraceae bacterium]|nr:hypothetical protein [Candidatus Baltobacteraceae bacterium]
MKHSIAALAIALGLAAAGPVMAYPANGTAPADQTSSAQSSRHTEKVKLEELPQNIQTTINQHLEGGKVRKVEQVSENGQTFYEVSLKDAQGDKEMFKVDSTGQYLGPATTQQNMNQTAPNSTTPTSGGLRPSQQER